jgi:DNA-binding transcriptional regulator YhcF (GntR family)
MQLWFAHHSEVSIREQLVTQIVLGILSDDLVPGQRLPSTRELARRFHLHPNTVSSGYRQLQREQWVELRHGSGVFVRDSKPEVSLSSALVLDQLIANLFCSARKAGAPLSGIRARLRQWLELQPPDHFLLIEPDEELRRIVAVEMQQAVTLPVRSCGLQDSHMRETIESAVPVVLPSKAKVVRKALPAGTELLTLQILFPRRLRNGCLRQRGCWSASRPDGQTF